MANEIIAMLRQIDATPGASGLPQFDVVTNLGRGLGFPGGAKTPFKPQIVAAYYPIFVPALALLGTGVTVSLFLVDDVANPSPGGTATFDVQFALVTTGTTVMTDALFSGTNDAVQITMPATAGIVKIQTIAHVAGHFAGTVVTNGWSWLRIRRNPAASDTHTGRIILLQANIVNT